jgi:four helix bundle protein
MTENDLKARTKGFALRVIRLIDALPKSTAGRAISNQIIRSATSVGANYRAACRSRSPAEFIAKLGVVVEEADESLYWLELILESNMVPQSRLGPLLTEANEITAIMVASRRTLQRNTAQASSVNRKSKVENRK